MFSPESSEKSTLDDDLAEFERPRVRTAEEYDLLLEKHPDRWVAMGEDGLLAVGDSEEDVYEAIVKQGLHRPVVVVEYLDTVPPVLIL